MADIIKTCVTMCECPNCGRRFLTERGAKRHIDFHCKGVTEVKKTEDSERILGIPLFELQSS